VVEYTAPGCSWGWGSWRSGFDGDESVTGEIVRRGAGRGVATPLNGAAYAMLREVEGGIRGIGRADIEPLAALRWSAAPAGFSTGRRGVNRMTKRDPRAAGSGA
jgi:hypothetical protein